MTYWAAGSVAVATIGSAVIGSDAARKAGNQANAASMYAADLSNAQYNQTRKDMQPWMTSGGKANDQMSNLMGFGGADAQNNAFSQFRQDPAYQFNLNQGISAANRSFAPSGLKSGKAQASLMQLGQGMADNSYSSYWNRLMGMSNSGQNSAAGVGQQGMNNAAQAGGAMMQGAKQSGMYEMQGAQLQGNALQSGANDAMFYNLMKKPAV